MISSLVIRIVVYLSLLILASAGCLFNYIGLVAQLVRARA